MGKSHSTPKDLVFVWYKLLTCLKPTLYCFVVIKLIYLYIYVHSHYYKE
jgi:hypothetical protein